MHSKVAIVRRPPSNGARVLAEQVGIRRFTPEGANTARAPILINWSGAGPIKARATQRVINKPFAVELAVDKTKTLEVLNKADVPCLKFGTNYAELRAENKKAIIFGRRTTTGSEGKGIELYGPEQTPPTPCPLYTVFFKKDWEVRVHVFGGEVIHIQQKRRRSGLDSDSRTALEKMVRSHDNGWVFVEKDFTITHNQAEACGALAVKAVTALGLDFGAVDILGRNNAGPADYDTVVCEVNTKPGIESTMTLHAYANAIERLGEGRSTKA